MDMNYDYTAKGDIHIAIQINSNVQNDNDLFTNTIKWIEDMMEGRGIKLIGSRGNMNNIWEHTLDYAIYDNSEVI